MGKGKVAVEYKIREGHLVHRVKYFPTLAEAHRWVDHMQRTNPRFMGLVSIDPIQAGDPSMEVE